MPADAKAAICNIALQRAQLAKRLQVFDTDTSAEAGACRDIYDLARDQTLRRFDWPFARAQAQLSALGSLAYDATATYAVGDTRSYGGRVYLSLQAANLNKQPDTSGTFWRRVSLDGWQYVYTLPADCVRVIEVWSGANDPRDSESVASRIGYDQALGKLLFLNWQNPDLRYTARVDSPVLYPPEFVDAFAWELSDDLAQSLKGDAQLAALNRQAADAAILRAISDSLREEEPGQQPDSLFISSRS